MEAVRGTAAIRAPMAPSDDGSSLVHTWTNTRPRFVSLLDDWLRRATAHEQTLWLVVLLALAADVLLTTYGLQQGLTEVNPVARTAIDSIGAWSMVPLKAAAVGVGLVCRPLLPEEYTAMIPIGLAIPWLVASVINATLIVAV